MMVPQTPYTNGSISKLKGVTANNLLAVGGSGPQAFMWRFNGSDWTTISSFPSTLSALSDVDSKDGEWVFGSCEGGEGVLMSTLNFQDWTVVENPEVGCMSTVWMPWKGASLAGASLAGDVIQPGDARLHVRSQGECSSGEPIDGLAVGVNSIIPLTGSTFLIATQGYGGGTTRSYIGSYQ